MAPPEPRLPPPDLDSRTLPFAAGKGTYQRISHERFKSPLFWSKTGRYRFDRPDAPYGTLYMANDVECAMVEVFGDQWLGATRLGRSITQAELDENKIYKMTVKGRVRVIDLRGDNLNKLGADGNLFTGRYEVSQQWAVDFMMHPRKPDGIFFPSRKNPEKLNLALFSTDTSKKAIGYDDGRPLSEVDEVYDVLEKYEVGIIA